jgi:biotin transport system ATP-binding protein
MIRLDHVTHRYDDRVVLDDVDLELSERRIAVIGANGSGKSTFARLLNGLVVPDSGTVTVDGLDTATQGAEVRRRVGFLFTNPEAQIVMPTVGEDVAFSLRRSGLSPEQVRAKVGETLRSLDLGGLEDRPSTHLSGGQKQLLALASMLVLEPDVLVCDEPTTLLDLRHSRQVHGILAALPLQLVLVTHDLDLASDSDRVLVFDEGRVVADGAPAEAIAHYRGLAR